MRLYELIHKARAYLSRKRPPKIDVDLVMIRRTLDGASRVRCDYRTSDRMRPEDFEITEEALRRQRALSVRVAYQRCILRAQHEAWLQLLF